MRSLEFFSSFFGEARCENLVGILCEGTLETEVVRYGNRWLCVVAAGLSG